MLEKLEDIKGVIGSRNRRRKENTMTKIKTTKEQTKLSNKKPTKNRSELRCSGWKNSSSSTCGTLRGTLVTNG
jgi:hypothetical protein